MNTRTELVKVKMLIKMVNLVIPRPLIVKLIDRSTAEYWHNKGNGYQCESGHWVNQDLRRADRSAQFFCETTGQTKTESTNRKPKIDVEGRNSKSGTNFKNMNILYCN